MSGHHQDQAKYVAYVLWLIGYSYATIGKVLQLKRSQVGGIIDRSEYAGRSSMTAAQRAAHLKELQEIRFEDGRPIDGGLLDRVAFTIIA
ncbi:hypothetical protein U8P76_10735 [Rhizobium johnstonii]|uniref:hypothetical protein n=1 Tax=Rhizobium leguminosarum TaxID=384 RepID=UPI00102FB3CC|nr:hypothetical protein [Rhizobium leguminosarum]TBG20625.1 hypothetical protein ELG81_08695 [Rhizobium leguminosarum]TBG46541.1 hypothetical protein ELG75_08710 [Rhizobium leguminosarum]TBG79512.1 hypothetical protein ELG76_09045 [Rhizobium leguminosarum]WSG97225.1 hypothetical protein U8P76_10735 [Rhizobium johnstonii]